MYRAFYLVLTGIGISFIVKSAIHININFPRVATQWALVISIITLSMHIVIILINNSETNYYIEPIRYWFSTNSMIKLGLVFLKIITIILIIHDKA